MVRNLDDCTPVTVFMHVYMYLQNGLAASYLGRDGASPRIYPLLVMILGNGYIGDRGETETPAVDRPICDREEESDQYTS